MARSLQTAVCLLILAQMNSLLSAMDEQSPIPSALYPDNVLVWSQMVVRIVDPEDRPVAGVTVQPWALRAGAGIGNWNIEKYGQPLITTTDVTGKAVVTFPAVNEWSHNDKHLVDQVTLEIQHPDFCSKNSEATVLEDTVTIQDIALERGTKLRFAGVKPGSDQPLSDCHVMFEGQQSIASEFDREPSGWLKSRPVKDDQRWYQIVRLAPGELPQFSSPQAWNPDDPDSKERTVAVHPGVRVVGKISDDVPRPIRRGYVVVRCGSPARPDEEGNRKPNEPFWWNDYTQIAEDGSFEFPALPAGTLGQFYAYANDHISAQPTDEAYEACCKWFGLEVEGRHPKFRYGQVLRLFRDKLQLKIEMELAGEVRVKCTDAAGQPLKGIEVISCPNQYMVAAGSTALCCRISSSEVLLTNFRLVPGEVWKRSPYYSETDDDGVALIRNLPEGIQTIFAASDQWGMKAEEPKFKSQPGGVAELTVQLERTGR